MNPNFTHSLIAGIAAAVLFLLILASGLGFFFLFLPSLPLLVYGMGRDAQIAQWGTGIASVIIALAAGPAVAVLFLLGVGLPSCYIAKRAVMSYASSVTLASGRDLQLIAWYPIGQIFMHLTLYGCALVSLVGLVYLAQPGGLEAVIAQQIEEGFKDAQGEMRDAVDMLAGRWSFLVFSCMLWLWALALYAHLWVASLILEKKKWLRRPNIAVMPYIIPGWMFSLMAICALASLIGGPTVGFLGKTVLIALMLPYFLLGIGLMHITSLAWPNRKIFLFFIYFFVFSQFWPAFILSGVGIAHQIKRLYLQPTSTKS